ncbi:MAG: hypothetical protein U0610_11005 [bacterium]
MNRSRRTLSLVTSMLLACGAIAQRAHAQPEFVPDLQAQHPIAVSGNTTTFTPNIAIVVGHDGSMMEDIATGRAQFLAGDFNEAIPTTGCIGAACACTGGATASSYVASPTLFNPALFRLYCGDSSATSAADGLGPLLADIHNVNLFDNASGTAGDQYQSFMLRNFPDIDFSSSDSCLTNKCSEGTTTGGDAVYQYAGTTYAEGTDFTGPDGSGDLCARAGVNCELLTGPGAGDGVTDRSVYPWDSDPTYQLNARFNYQPTAGGGTPFHRVDGDFPFLDPFTGFDFNHPIRMDDPGSATTRWRKSKLRASMCAVEGLLGLNRYRQLADGSFLNCDLDDLGDGVSDDADSDGYDDFYEDNIRGSFTTPSTVSKASVGLYKTYQISPGLYPPFDNDNNFTENRLRVDLRVAGFYPPGSTNPGSVSFGCNAAGDDACDRSIALLSPDVNRNFSDDNRWHECMGLGRNTQSAVALHGPLADDDAAFSAALDTRFGTPGGVMSLSGILRDACGDNGDCPGASSTLPRLVPNTGIFGADSNSCGSSNALVVITDSADSCAAASCGVKVSPEDIPTSIGERLPGYPSTPAQPFPANATESKTCPENIATAMRASSVEAKTYIVGLDADWDAATKQAMAKVAAAGGTNSYYSARSFSDVQNALRAIFNDVKFSADAVIPAGVLALGIARSDATGLKDVVIDARYKPQNWQGFLFARSITQSGQPLAFWEAGSLLAARDLSLAAQARNTFVTMDTDCSGQIKGSDELVVLGTSNLDLTSAGGYYNSTRHPTCTGTPRTSLTNVHTTGAPFFLDGPTGTNRDGSALAMIGYTIGLTPTQIAAIPSVGTVPSYRSRDFDGDGTTGNSVWRLYDSVNSSPVIVGPSLSIQPNDADADADGLSDFEEYQAQILDRPRVAYIGTNGGSLHAFNVDGDTSIQVNGAVVNAASAKAGGELFAVWPYEILNRLKRYANSRYGTVTGSHTYPVHEDGLDLTARIFDAKIYPNTEGAPLFGWRTVLVIGFRNGGHGYVAFDVTDPSESIGIQDLNSAGSLVAYKYPTLMWEYDEFKDDGHDAVGNPVVADATQCDDLAERQTNAGCEDNGLDDDVVDRQGHTWSIPFVTRSRSGAGNPAMYVLSGPGTVDHTASPSSGAGYLLAIDLPSGQLLDLDSTSANGLPLQVADPAITTGPNAGPVCIGGSGVSCSGGQFIAPFRTSIVGADITTADDATYSGQRADVLYWGDLGGRLWRARLANPATNDVEAKVVFFPGADADTVDTAHPIVSRPSLTPARNQTLLGNPPPIWVEFGDGSLAFGAKDVTEQVYPVDEVASNAKFRIFSIVDDASTGTAQYFDFADETNCDDGTGAIDSAGDDPTGNSGGDLDNRTVASSTYPSITDRQEPASGTHPPTRTGGYYQCLANDAGAGIPGALGSERILGSPAILAGTVFVETMRPVDPSSVSNVCYNVGAGSILVFDYDTGRLINFKLKGGMTQVGSGKYYIAPENPVAVANTPGYKALGAPPDGFPPDFLRYHAITGVEPPAPQIPMETLYWREPF